MRHSSSQLLLCPHFCVQGNYVGSLKLAVVELYHRSEQMWQFRPLSFHFESWLLNIYHHFSLHYECCRLSSIPCTNAYVLKSPLLLPQNLNVYPEFVWVLTEVIKCVFMVRHCPKWVTSLKEERMGTALWLSQIKLLPAVSKSHIGSSYFPSGQLSTIRIWAHWPCKKTRLKIRMNRTEIGTLTWDASGSSFSLTCCAIKPVPRGDSSWLHYIVFNSRSIFHFLHWLH